MTEIKRLVTEALELATDSMNEYTQANPDRELAMYYDKQISLLEQVLRVTK